MNCKYVAVSSGKGGVGKTLSSISMALALRRAGLTVTLVDCDLSLSNVDVVLGIQCKYDLSDVFQNRAKIEDIICTSEDGLMVVPAASGVTEMLSLNKEKKSVMRSILRSIEKLSDVIIFDTAAGISEDVLYFQSLASQNVIVATPDPHSITDAYATIKVLSEKKKINDFNLLTNFCRSEEEGTKVFKRIADVSMNFLGVRLQHIGNVKMDPVLSSKVRYGKTSNFDLLSTVAGQSLANAAKNMVLDRSISQPLDARHPFVSATSKRLNEKVRPYNGLSGLEKTKNLL